MLEHLFTDFILPPEVLKSRRNLIIISFCVIAFYILSPHITELKLAGVEVKISGNMNINIILFCVILFEIMTFTLRFFVSISSEPLKKLELERNDIEQSLMNLTEGEWHSKKYGISSTGFDEYKLDLMRRIEELKNVHSKRKRSLSLQHIISELLMPIAVASSACTLCMINIVKSFS